MSVQRLVDLAQVLPEPLLLLTVAGTIAGANAAAGELLGRPAERLSGESFASLTADDAAVVAGYLSACARSRTLLPGAFTIRMEHGGTIRCRCDGALADRDAAPDGPLIVMRLRSADAASTRFILLNQQIEELSREVGERRQVESERLELLSRTRLAQQELEREREALIHARDALLARSRELERARGRLERLQAATAALSSALTPSHVALVVLEHCMAALDALAVSTVLIDESGAGMRVIQHTGYPAELMQSWTTIPLDSPVPLAVAARTGEAVFVESVAHWREIMGVDPPPRLLPNAHSWVALPLWVEDRRLGAIGLSFEREGPFAPDERSFMLALAQQSAQALERARLFADAERARADAEAANRAKMEFLATMSHELRTPLNAIAGYTELLELEIRGPITDVQREDLRRIRRSQRHLLSLVNDVLNFARIEAGQVRYDIAPVPLDDALREMESMIIPLLNERGLRYEYDGVDGDVRIRADREKVQQVVLNLLTNAVKFSDPGGVVRLAVDIGDFDVAIRVMDTGRGIPEDKLEEIFEPFVQIERGLTRTRDGAGLGLAISRQLARAMAGDLGVHSMPGKGATFILTLPLAGDSRRTLELSPGELRAHHA